MNLENEEKEKIDSEGNLEIKDIIPKWLKDMKIKGIIEFYNEMENHIRKSILKNLKCGKRLAQLPLYKRVSKGHAIIGLIITSIRKRRDFSHSRSCLRILTLSFDDLYLHNFATLSFNSNYKNEENNNDNNNNENKEINEHNNDQTYEHSGQLNLSNLSNLSNLINAGSLKCLILPHDEVYITKDGNYPILGIANVGKVSSTEVELKTYESSFNVGDSIVLDVYTPSRWYSSENFSLFNLLTNHNASRLRSLLIEKDIPRYLLPNSNNHLTIDDLIITAPQLNTNQLFALQKSLLCQDYQIINAPLSSGRHLFIAKLCEHLLKRGDSVLVCSYFYSSITKLGFILKNYGIKFILCAKSNKIHPDLQEFCLEHLLQSQISEKSTLIENSDTHSNNLNKNMNENMNEIINETNEELILNNTSARESNRKINEFNLFITSSTLKMYNTIMTRHFDTVIFLDSSLLSLLKAVPSLIDCKRFISIGDPIVDSCFPQYKTSLHSHLLRIHPETCISFNQIYHVHPCLVSVSKILRGEEITSIYLSKFNQFSEENDQIPKEENQIENNNNNNKSLISKTFWNFPEDNEVDSRKFAKSFPRKMRKVIKMIVGNKCPFLIINGRFLFTDKMKTQQYNCAISIISSILIAAARGEATLVGKRKKVAKIGIILEKIIKTPELYFGKHINALARATSQVEIEYPFSLRTKRANNIVCITDEGQNSIEGIGLCCSKNKVILVGENEGGFLKDQIPNDLIIDIDNDWILNGNVFTNNFLDICSIFE